LGLGVFMLGTLVVMGATEMNRLSRMFEADADLPEGCAAMLSELDQALQAVNARLRVERPGLQWEGAEPGPDPDSLLPPVAMRVAGLQLEGIAWNADTPIAFVNGRVVTVPGEVEGLQVVAIEESRILLRDEQGNTAELDLNEKHGASSQPAE
jgi:hypothetical protein